MANASKLLSKFRIDDINLEKDALVNQAHTAYSDKRYALAEARKAMTEASKKLHDLLDAPLRSAGHVPQGKDWSLTEDDEALGLIIQVWSEPKKRGRRKPALPIQQVSFSAKGPKAA